MILRVLVGTAAATVVLLACPVGARAAEQLVLVDAAVPSELDGDQLGATVTILNGADEVTLPSSLGVSGSGSCRITIARPGLPAHQQTAVTLSFGRECFPDATSEVLGPASFVVDLDGPGTLPPVTVKSPSTEKSAWTAVRTGLAVGTVFGLLLVLRGGWLHREAQTRTTAPGAASAADVAYRRVRHIVDARWRQLGLPRTTRLRWKDLPVRSYGLRDAVSGLEAGWSLKDSWISNLTAGIGAVLAVGTSTDLLTGLLGQEPKAALRVIAVAALVSAGLLALSSMLVKLIGPTPDAVTVGGLLVSTGIIAMAAVSQIVAVDAVLEVALDLGDSASTWLLRAGALALVVLTMRYLDEKLAKTIDEGVPPSGVPAIPAEALDSWRATYEWEKQLVSERIRTAFAAWLKPESQPDTRVGRPVAPTGAVKGAAEFGAGVERPPLELATTRSMF